jgi:hypothetical protein
MSKKIGLEEVKRVISRTEIDDRLQAQILNDLNEIINQEDEEEKTQSLKKQFAVIVYDPDGRLRGYNFTASVCQIPEECSPYEVEDKLIKSAYDFNQTPKGRRLPVRSIAETCEVVGAKITKEHQVWIKTKEQVLVVRSENVIPMDEFKKISQIDRE